MGKINGPGQEGAGVFNGDMGIIVEIDDEEQKIKVLFDDESLWNMITLFGRA